MEYGDDLRLRLGAQVDQKVAARNEVETRERRVRQHVLHGEHDAGAQLGRHPVGMILPGEERRQTIRRDVGLDRLRIEAVASDRHRIRVDVAGEDLQLDVALRDVNLLAKQHGERIGLFAGTAAGDPDPQRSIQSMIAHEVGNDALRPESRRPARRERNP